MKVFSLREAEASRDIDIKMMATRSSRYRVFGTSERIQVEIWRVDLATGLNRRIRLASPCSIVTR